MQTPTIEGLTVYLFGKLDFPWKLQEVEILHDTYFRTRWNKSSLRIGKLLESIFTTAESSRDVSHSRNGRQGSVSLSDSQWRTFQEIA